MKTTRRASWIFIGAAILVFILVVLVSARITSAMDTTQVVTSWDMLFQQQSANPIYLPVIGGSAQPDSYDLSQNSRDNGLGIQDWGESETP